MTAKATLRSFQDEIDTIHHKETLKQRIQAQISTERETTRKTVKSKDATDAKDNDQADVVPPAQGYQFDDDSQLQVRRVLRLHQYCSYLSFRHGAVWIQLLHMKWLVMP